MPSRGFGRPSEVRHLGRPEALPWIDGGGRRLCPGINGDGGAATAMGTAEGIATNRGGTLRRDPRLIRVRDRSRDVSSLLWSCSRPQGPDSCSASAPAPQYAFEK